MAKSGAFVSKGPATASPFVFGKSYGLASAKGVSICHYQVALSLNNYVGVYAKPLEIIYKAMH